MTFSIPEIYIRPEGEKEIHYTKYSCKEERPMYNTNLTKYTDREEYK